MHPLVMPTSARHRRTLTTPQRLRIATTILLTVALVAALGVFGGSLTTQTDMLQWFSTRGISLALIGWAVYALPLLAFAAVISPSLGPLRRSLAWLVLPPALFAAALMSRPRTMSTAEWKLAIDPTFVAASQLMAYALLAGAAVYAISCAITISRNPATPMDDLLLKLRRNASRVTIFAVLSPLITLVL